MVKVGLIHARTRRVTAEMIPNLSHLIFRRLHSAKPNARGSQGQIGRDKRARRGGGEGAKIKSRSADGHGRTDGARGSESVGGDGVCVYVPVQLRAWRRRFCFGRPPWVLSGSESSGGAWRTPGGRRAGESARERGRVPEGRSRGVERLTEGAGGGERVGRAGDVRRGRVGRGLLGRGRVHGGVREAGVEVVDGREGRLGAAGVSGEGRGGRGRRTIGGGHARRRHGAVRSAGRDAVGVHGPGHTEGAEGGEEESQRTWVK